MLSRLYIENIALIERLDLELHDGFTILTGETGAGKSIIIDSVNLILGGRADKTLIKAGENKALVEAVFDIPAEMMEAQFAHWGIDSADGQIILSRELTDSGRNVCRINGKLGSLSTLKEMAVSLIDIYGQHEHQRLFDVQTHLLFLDAYGEEAIDVQKKQVAETYRKWKKLKYQLKNEIGNEAQRLQRVDMLRAQAEEIENAALQSGEEDVLNEERAILADAERIQKTLHEVSAWLNGDDETDAALQHIRNAEKQMASISDIGVSFEAIRARLNEFYYLLQEIYFETTTLQDDAVFDPYRYDEVEQRLEVISKLKRKYGENVEAVIAYAETARAELERMADLQDIAERGAEAMLALSKELYAQAMALHHIRIETAKKLKADLTKQLHDLGMEKAAFAIRFESIPDYTPDMDFFEHGLDAVEMMLSTNPGEPLKPLRKVASGGELSRITLAFKSLAADMDENIAMIFDEIDTGISGRISSVVGAKMRSISKGHQVICVTHSPQIAAMADIHYLIEKEQGLHHTRTNVRLLDKEEHIREIARIAGGATITDQTLAYARDLVEHAQSEEQK